MEARVELCGVRIRKGTAPFDATLEAGDAVAVCGPANSGKSALLGFIAGRLRPVAGKVRVAGSVAEPGPPSFTLRTSPQSLARRACGGKLAAAAEALSAVGLWESRRTSWSGLSPGQQAACTLLPLFDPEAGVRVIDCELDALGPWVLGGVIDALRDFGGVMVAATNRTDVAEALGRVLVLRGAEARYFGPIDDLVRRARPARIVVETADPGAVRAICEPFTIEAEEFPGVLCLTTNEGEALAAKLLLEGYGSVRSVVVRHATLAEAIIRI